jgi:hypothetical protein
MNTTVDRISSPDRSLVTTWLYDNDGNRGSHSDHRIDVSSAIIVLGTPVARAWPIAARSTRAISPHSGQSLQSMIPIMISEPIATSTGQINGNSSSTPITTARKRGLLFTCAKRQPATPIRTSPFGPQQRRPISRTRSVPDYGKFEGSPNQGAGTVGGSCAKPDSPKSKFREWNQAGWRVQGAGVKIFRLLFSENQQLLLHPVSVRRGVSLTSRHVRRRCGGRGCAC